MKVLRRLAAYLRKEYNLTPLPAEPDPETGRRRPPLYYLCDYWGNHFV